MYQVDYIKNLINESPLGSTLSLFNVIDLIVEWPETLRNDDNVTLLLNVLNI